MMPLRRFCKWPSNDSLPSTSSFGQSESEHTEDEADSCPERDGCCGRKEFLSSDEFEDVPSPCLSDESLCRHDTPGLISSPRATFSTASVTPGDLVFAQKCADLHRFTQPLLELLEGLKTGRFDKGLTMLQQRVAIDRLQRILGVLQKPDMGEKYLHHLLQIEIMLKLWFPRLVYESVEKPEQTRPLQLPPHWCQNQLHMPVKKRKLSCLDLDHTGTNSYNHRHHQHKISCHCYVSTCLPVAPKKSKTPEGKAAQCSCRAAYEFSPSYLCNRREKAHRRRRGISSLSRCDIQATQDNSVSSSDTADSP